MKSHFKAVNKSGPYPFRISFIEVDPHGFSFIEVVNLNLTSWGTRCLEYISSEKRFVSVLDFFCFEFALRLWPSDLSHEYSTLESTNPNNRCKVFLQLF